MLFWPDLELQDDEESTSHWFCWSSAVTGGDIEAAATAAAVNDILCEEEVDETGDPATECECEVLTLWQLEVFR